MRAGMVRAWLAILTLGATGAALSTAECFCGPRAGSMPARGSAPGDAIRLPLRAESPPHRPWGRAFSPLVAAGIIPRTLPSGIEQAFGPAAFFAQLWPASAKPPLSTSAIGAKHVSPG